MLSLLKKLFACKLISIKSLSTLDQEPKPTSGTAADKTPVAQSCPQTVPIVGTNQNTLQVPASEFAKCASIGPACSRLQISDIPQVITQLNAQLERLNISPDAFDDFYGNSLLGVCPICNEYCAGRGLCRMPLLAAAGDNVRFTGNSGGFERMMQGKCLTYSCSSTEFDLFWCPDLHPEMRRDLKRRGINLDPNIQQKRNHLWRPQY